MKRSLSKPTSESQPLFQQEVYTPLQQRSQDTQRAILDAALDLFTTQGYEGTSVAQIAKAAGCSVGACYRRFKNKEASA